MSDVQPEVPPEQEMPDVFISEDMFSEFLGEVNAGMHEIREEEKPDQLPPLSDDESGLFGDISSPVGDGECSVCGAPTFRPPGLTPSGRKKRIPSRCDLHSTNVRLSKERPDFTGVESQLQRIQEELADDIRLLGILTGPLFPVTGYYVTEHADPFTVAILKLAKNNQRILRVLHRAAQVAPIYTVAECVAGTAYAVQVDTHKVDPHNNIARRLGVSRAYDAIYPNSVPGDEYNIGNNGFTGPPRYAGTQ